MKRASILATLILVMSQLGWADEPPTVDPDLGSTPDIGQTDSRAN